MYVDNSHLLKQYSTDPAELALTVWVTSDNSFVIQKQGKMFLVSESKIAKPVKNGKCWGFGKAFYH